MTSHAKHFKSWLNSKDGKRSIKNAARRISEIKLKRLELKRATINKLNKVVSSISPCSLEGKL